MFEFSVSACAFIKSLLRLDFAEFLVRQSLLIAREVGSNAPKADTGQADKDKM